MSFSVGGSQSQKIALVQDAIQKFRLSLDRHFSASYGDVIRYGREFESCIVGDARQSILTAGSAEETHYSLPADYDKALAAIGKFFHKM